VRDILIIKIGEELDGQASWLRMGDAIPQPHIESGPLDQAVQKASGARVVGLVPSTAVLLTYARVPSQNRQRMLNAIPFALEEDLATDIDSLHFAVGRIEEDGAIPVAVVDRNLMEQWQQLFTNAGLAVDVLVPDVFALPNDANTWNLVVDANKALLRTGEQSGVAFETENLGFILSLLLKQKSEEDKPESIEVWQDAERGDLLPLNSDEVEVKNHANTSGILGLISKIEFDPSNAINLLQGAFSKSEQIGKYLRPWRIAAVLLVAWFVFALSNAILKSSALEAKSAALRAEAVHIYRATFPDEKKVIKPKGQMQQKLRKLKNGDNKSGLTFMDMLDQTGDVINKTSGLVLRSVRYKNSVMDIDLELPNLQLLDQLKQKLSASKELSVEIQSAASRDNKVQGRLQIKAAN